ncbi:MAG: hypothetical protein WCK59_04230 [Candidatus Falkowbacteria bacterium]
MKTRLYLVHGIFFQNNLMLGISLDSEIGERAEIQPATFRTMFAGVIKFTDNFYDGVGALSDNYGPSVLTDVSLEGNIIRFKKKYERRSDIISYELKKDEDAWIGSYFGPAVGKGAVRCLLTPISEEFFLPTGLEKFFEDYLPF